MPGIALLAGRTARQLFSGGFGVRPSLVSHELVTDIDHMLHQGRVSKCKMPFSKTVIVDRRSVRCEQVDMKLAVCGAEEMNRICVARYLAEEEASESAQMTATHAQRTLRMIRIAGSQIQR